MNVNGIKDLSTIKVPPFLEYENNMTILQTYYNDVKILATCLTSGDALHGSFH